MADGNESFEPASEVEELKRALAEQTRRGQDWEAEIARLRKAYGAAVRSLCERHWTLLAANRNPRLLGAGRRNARQEDIIATSILFDPEWYAARYLDASEIRPKPCAALLQDRRRERLRAGTRFFGPQIRRTIPRCCAGCEQQSWSLRNARTSGGAWDQSIGVGGNHCVSSAARAAVRPIDP